ncbi:M20/M25/M40 family metallo-hydrolase [Haloarculaceae archaeon H-GB11]|nr:M20/M25/M40 family metallo-hydrolase [Haloarculaceae archaeon H-GB11]
MLEADALDADGCVIGETTCEGGRHAVTVADKGSIWLTLEATGEGAHGSRPMLGESAVDRLYDCIQYLRRSLTNRELELDEAVAPIIEESVAYYTQDLGEAAARELFTHPTINLGVFEGGETINSVPEAARAMLDVRISPGVHTPSVLADIRDCIGECEGTIVEDVSWSIGTFVDEDDPVVTATADVAESVTGTHVYRRSATGGGDAKNLRNAGIPTIEFGVGTDSVHAVDEYTTVDALEANATVYAELPWAFADRL